MEVLLRRRKDGAKRGKWEGDKGHRQISGIFLRSLKDERTGFGVQGRDMTEVVHQGGNPQKENRQLYA